MPAYKFKSSGKLFGKTSKKEIQDIIEERKMPLGIAFPVELSHGDKSSLFKMNFDQLEQVKQNFKNLLLTSPGERLGRYNFGAGLRNITFEMIAHDKDFESKVMKLIQDATQTYMPYIKLKTLTSENFKIETQSSNKSMVKFLLQVNFDIPVLNVSNEKIMLILYVAG
jgi:phage baseplate assembly protein W